MKQLYPCSMAWLQIFENILSNVSGMGYSSLNKIYRESSNMRCVSDLPIIGSDNGLSPSRRQAIILTNAGLLLIRTKLEQASVEF